MAKVKILFKGGQEEALRYEEKIGDLTDIKLQWKNINKDNNSNNN